MVNGVMVFGMHFVSLMHSNERLSMPLEHREGADALKAIAGMMGILLRNGTLTLGSDGQVRIKAS